MTDTDPNVISTLNESELKVKKIYTFINGAKVMITDSKLNWLLLLAPISLSLNSNKQPILVFIFSLISIAPLAERLGFVTEQLSLHTNQTIGGLLNATFGNATELIVCLVALSKGLFIIIKLSLLGSMLSNLLLVLGCAFISIGSTKISKFNILYSQLNLPILGLIFIAIISPSLMLYTNKINENESLTLSRIYSLILFLSYIGYLIFQLVTHTHLFNDEENNENENINPLTNDIESQEIKQEIKTNSPRYENSSYSVTTDYEKPTLIKLPSIKELKKSNSSKTDDEDVLGINYGLLWLTIITIAISFLSDALVNSIQNISGNVSVLFLSVIVIPIIGNAAEHTSAIMFAIQDKLDLSLGIAIGSASQIGGCVLPLLVLIGWITNKKLDLIFESYEILCLFLSLLMLSYTIKDGNTSWLQGLILIFTYILLAIGFLYHKDIKL